MTLAASLLEDFDIEMAGTRTTLERIPADKITYKCHDKSMAMGRLAMHVATLPGFGSNVITADVCDLGTHPSPSLVFVSTENMLAQFDVLAAELRASIAGASDEQLRAPWKLVFGDAVIGEGPRTLMYRSMFLNHLVHHRAQLGVYLRLNGLPVPPLYGPSADDRMGF